MALTDPIVRKPTPADGAVRIRRLVNQTLTIMEQNLKMMNQVVQKHGRPAIATALGPDAAQLQGVYDQLRTCLQQIDSSRQPPALTS
jgi:hypothetical protein